MYCARDKATGRTGKEAMAAVDDSAGSTYRQPLTRCDF